MAAENLYGIDPQLMAEFIDESQDLLENAANSFIDLEHNPDNREAIDSVFRVVHTIKGNSAFFNLMKVKSLAHALEDLMAQVRDGKRAFAKPVPDVLLNGLDALKAMMARIREGKPETEDEAGYEDRLRELRAIVDEGRQRDAAQLWERLSTDLAVFKRKFISADDELDVLLGQIAGAVTELSPLGKTGKAKTTLPAAEALPAVKPAEGLPGPEKDAAVSKQKSMRIDEWRIDQFLEYVGELLLIEEMYDHLLKRVNSDSGTNRLVQDLKKSNASLSRLSQRLQFSILEVRKVPLKVLLQKAPKLARDVAAVKGKEVAVALSGEELRIDKSLLESLEAPFIHLVRNAVDHGVESPEERAKSGKPRAGKVNIAATEDEDLLYVRVEDDGGGIDTEKVKKIAIERGLITADKAAALSEREVFDFLFEPGFSTAEQITDISGRGVGMEVVRQNVQALGGDIAIDSRKGQGSRFILRVPKSVTVQIIRGFIVAAEQQQFIIPANFIGESFNVAPDNISSVVGRGECIMHHDRIFPMIRLASLLSLRRPAGNSAGGIGIILTVNKREFVLLVDQVLGMTQVVVKDIGGLTGLSPLIKGGAILGDEKVTVVLNPEAVILT